MEYRSTDNGDEPGCCGAGGRSERSPTRVLQTLQVLPMSMGKTQMKGMQLTRPDELHMLMGTVVCLPAMLLPPTVTFDPGCQAEVHAVTWALQAVLADYPVIGGRLLTSKKASQVLGSKLTPPPKPSPDRILVYPHCQGPPAHRGRLHDSIATSSADGSGQDGVVWGVELTAVQLTGVTWGDLHTYATQRRSTSLNPKPSEALPPYLPAMDGKAVSRGEEPLARAQISWAEGGGVVLGITISHVAADACTLSFIMTNVVSKAQQHLASHVTWGPLPPSYNPKDAALQLPTDNCPAGANPATEPPDCKIEVTSSGDAAHSPAATASGGSCAATLDSNSGSHAHSATTPTATAPDCHFDRSNLHPKPVCVRSPDAQQALDWVTVTAEQEGAAGFGQLMRANSAAFKSLGLDVKQLGWGCVTQGLVTPVLHLTAQDLQRLKVACQGVLSSSPSTAGLRLSQHDMAGAVIWLLCCHTRGRVLPGQPLDDKFATTALGSHLQSRLFGVTIDMRQNCLNPPLVPLSHLGNASCSLHVRGTANAPGPDGKATLPSESHCAALPHVDWPCSWAPGDQAQATHIWIKELCRKQALQGAGSRSGPAWDTLVSVLAVAAARVREGVNMYRSIPDVGNVTLESFQDHAHAKGIAVLCTMAKYIAQFDGFLTSWAAFPMQPASPVLSASSTHPPLPPSSTHPTLPATAPATAAAAAAAAAAAPASPASAILSHLAATPPAVFQPIIHPLGPWSAIGIPGPALDGASEVSRTGADGLLLYFTTPGNCEEVLRESLLVKALAPSSKWL